MLKNIWVCARLGFTNANATVFFFFCRAAKKIKKKNKALKSKRTKNAFANRETHMLENVSPAQNVGGTLLFTHDHEIAERMDRVLTLVDGQLETI